MDVRKLPVRPIDCHKGNFGHVLVVGGDYGMAGACRLAGEAALRSGAGLVSVATRPEHACSIAGNCPELMCHGIIKTRDLDHLLERVSVVIVGSGLGQGIWSRALLNHVLDTKLPLVADADGLNMLSREAYRRDNWIITPHPGEAGRMLDCSSQDVQDDREAAIHKLQAQYGGVAVLKGAGSLILGPSQQLQTCGFPNPAMATAGMGDVLSGVIAALLAQKLSLEEAACLGVQTHADAGQRAARGYQRGMMARDLMPYIQECLN